MLALGYPPPFSLLTIISLTNNFLHYCFSHKNNSIYKIISQEDPKEFKTHFALLINTSIKNSAKLCLIDRTTDDR